MRRLHEAPLPFGQTTKWFLWLCAARVCVCVWVFVSVCVVYANVCVCVCVCVHFDVSALQRRHFNAFHISSGPKLDSPVSMKALTRIRPVGQRRIQLSLSRYNSRCRNAHIPLLYICRGEGVVSSAAYRPSASSNLSLCSLILWAICALAAQITSSRH